MFRGEHVHCTLYTDRFVQIHASNASHYLCLITCMCLISGRSVRTLCTATAACAGSQTGSKLATRSLASHAALDRTAWRENCCSPPPAKRFECQGEMTEGETLNAEDKSIRSIGFVDHKCIIVTLEHKTSHKGRFFEIEIYASSES